MLTRCSVAWLCLGQQGGQLQGHPLPVPLGLDLAALDRGLGGRHQPGVAPVEAVPEPLKAGPPARLADRLGSLLARQPLDVTLLRGG